MDSLNKKKIGFNIKRLRIDKNLSVKDASILFGNAESYIYKLESANFDSMNTINRVCEVYNCSIFELLADDKDPPNIVNDEPAEYKTTPCSEEMRRIMNLIEEYPETRRRISDYLELYREGGKARISGLNGILDALSPEKISELFSLAITKLSESKK